MTEEIRNKLKRKRVENAVDQNNPSTEDRFNNNRTVYVEGLPFESTEDEVMNFFKPGKVLEVRLPKWHDSGRLRGYGHVLFSTPDEATAALSLDGKMLKNRYLKVDRPMTPRTMQTKDPSTIIRPPGCKTIFVKNLPYDCTENQVHDAFFVFGKITNIRLAVWGHTKQLKGFGYVDFKSEESAEIAMKKCAVTPLSINGRPATCDFETGVPKGSFRETDGKLWRTKKTGKKEKTKRQSSSGRAAETDAGDDDTGAAIGDEEE